MTKTLALLAIALPTFGACGDDSAPGADAGVTFDRTIEIDGLVAGVEAYIDDGGVLHISCDNDDDCFATQGYFHASHRFFQMDLRRRLAQGRISEIVGAVALDTDHLWRSKMRSLDGTAIYQQMWDAANPETKSAISAYTRGVNAFLADADAQENGARVAIEYDFFLIEKRLDPWTELDSVASFLPILDALTNRAERILAYGEVHDLLPAGQANDLFGQWPASSSTVLPTISARRFGPAAPAKLLPPDQRAQLHRFRSLFAAARKAAGPQADHGGIGSNNWILAPSHTSTGGALFANDPHLALSNPAIWYLVHIDSKSRGGTVHVAGVSYPGLPGVFLGQNEDIAWGATTTLWDQTDVYMETLNEARDAVIYNGTEVPIETVEYEYKQKTGENSIYRTAQYLPHHGLILARDDEAGTAFSTRWIGQDADTDINFPVAMGRATTTAEAKAAIAATITTAGGNFVVADKAGDIGWYPYKRIPMRPWAGTYAPYLPVPGDGSADWGDFYDYADLPQSTNPSAGYLATANNDMTGHLADGDPTNDGQGPTQAFVWSGYRHERIIQRVAARDDHDLASMQNIQADTVSLLGQTTKTAILDAVDGASLTPAAIKVRDALMGWDDYSCPTGLASTDPAGAKDANTAAASIGCAAFHVAWTELVRASFFDELAEAGVTDRPDRTLNETLVFALTSPDKLSQTYWDDVSTTGAPENMSDTVALALDAAGTWLETEVGTDKDDWRWGRFHTLTLRADLFDASGVADFNGARYANDGGMFTVDVANLRDGYEGDYAHSAGASIRLACQVGPEDVGCTYELPGGQQHFFSNTQHYDDLLTPWLANQPRTMSFDIPTVAASAEESIQFVAPQ